jgi:hypothetical protein
VFHCRQDAGCALQSSGDYLTAQETKSGGPALGMPMKTMQAVSDLAGPFFRANQSLPSTTKESAPVVVEWRHRKMGVRPAIGSKRFRQSLERPAKKGDMNLRRHEP